MPKSFFQPLVAAEEDASLHDDSGSSSSCVIGNLPSSPSMKRRSNAQDDTSVDTTELVRSILHPSSHWKHPSTRAAVRNGYDKEECDDNSDNELVSIESMTPKYAESLNDAECRKSNDRVVMDEEDSDSVDTAELVQRIMHPRLEIPPSRIALDAENRPDMRSQIPKSLLIPSSMEHPARLAEGSQESSFCQDKDDDDFVLPDHSDSASESSSSCSSHLLEKENDDSFTLCKNADPSFGRLPNRPPDATTERSHVQPGVASGAWSSSQSDRRSKLDVLDTSFAHHNQVEPNPDRKMKGREECVVRQGLHGSAKRLSLNLLQSSVPKIPNSVEPDESIETFSDDEDEAFGFGKSASFALHRRRRFEETPRDTFPSIADSNQRQIRNKRSWTGNQNEADARTQSPDSLNQEVFVLHEGFDHKCSRRPSLSSTEYRHSVTHTNQERLRNSDIDTTHAAPQRRRPRIRDPNSRPLGLPHSTIPTKPIPFSLGQQVSVALGIGGTNNSNSEHSVTNTHSMASRQIRNDVFGGSGAGVGSYEILQHRKVTGNEQTDNTSSADSMCDEATHKCPNSKSKRVASSKPRRAFRRKKGYRSFASKRSGGGNWKTSRKRNGSRDGSNRRGKSPASAPWGGNTDDPELRHVGGAEMSF